MNAGNDIENMAYVQAKHPEAAVAQTHADIDEKRGSLNGSNSKTDCDSVDGIVTPTDEELKTLRRVSGKIPWAAYTVAFVELCERFSYYGTTAVFVNFIQQDMPPGSNTYV